MALDMWNKSKIKAYKALELTLQTVPFFKLVNCWETYLGSYPSLHRYLSTVNTFLPRQSS